VSSRFDVTGLLHSHKDKVTYITEVINSNRKRIKNELAEIYDELDNYLEQSYATAAPKLNELYFSPLEP